MIYITLSQNSGGRSGHILKDIMTVFILSYFIQNSEVVYHSSWQKQSILTNFLNVSTESINYDKRIEYRKTSWGGISKKNFFDLVETINKVRSENLDKNILITLYGAYRFHPFQLHNLYKENIIKTDYFSLIFIPTLKKLYFGVKVPDVENRVAIHIRRGDMAKNFINKGMDYAYFANIIRTINTILNIPIYIFSERLNSGDLLALKKERNVSLFLGDTASLKEDFYNMVTSKYLFISAGGFSTWAAYIALGSVFYDKNFVYHFGHIENPTNFNDYKIDILSSILSDILSKYKNKDVPLKKYRIKKSNLIRQLQKLPHNLHSLLPKRKIK